MVSPLFDSSEWQAVEGFDFSDITYHRSRNQGTVRIAFNRPEVRNAFRPPYGRRIIYGSRSRSTNS